MNHKKEMIELFQKLGHKHNLADVFRDFLEISAITISNAVDWTQADRREKKYLELVKNYSKEELVTIAKILAELTMALEREPGDVLGEVFMELELGNKFKGQFFTPISVARMMGEMTLSDNCTDIINKNGYITVNEPACGAGATIIGFALALKNRGYNYQTQMLLTAQDLDIRAVHMCYIQCSLLGIPGQVLHCNTITMEVFEVWRTPFYMIHNWPQKELENRRKYAALNINNKIKDLIRKVEKSLSA